MKKITVLSSLLLLFVLSSCTTTDLNVPMDVMEATQPEQVTFKGSYVCLPHKDGSGLDPDECAPGIQTEDGQYYGFDSALSSASPDVWALKEGDPLIASGVLMIPTEDLSIISGVEWDLYSIEKIFSATIRLKHESNFIFSYGYGPVKNELNTIQGTFTKDMIMDPAVLVPLELSDEEVQSVLDKIEVLNLIDEVPVYGDIRTVTDPCATYSLSTLSPSFSNTLNWDCNDMTVARTEFIDFMMKLIDSQEEVQALPEAVGGYM